MPHQRFDDDQAHRRAERYLASVLGGDWASKVRWDGDHLLQGHLDHSGSHFVLIAPRDNEHDPHVKLHGARSSGTTRWVHDRQVLVA
jgi:hypothetical protein